MPVNITGVTVKRSSRVKCNGSLLNYNPGHQGDAMNIISQVLHLCSTYIGVNDLLNFCKHPLFEERHMNNMLKKGVELYYLQYD